MPAPFGKTPVKTNERTSCRALTLIEILMIAGIIGVLAALLSLNVSGLTRNAERTSATSNLRELGHAGSMYASDHNGDVFPYRSSEWGGSLYWTQYLPYFYANGNTRLTMRTGDDFVQAANPSLKRRHAPVASVGNKEIFWSFARNLELPKPASSTFLDGTVKLSRLPQPARTMILIESQQNGAMYSTYPQDYFHFDADGPNGKTAAAFLDGHVELVSREMILGNGNSEAEAASRKLFWFGYPDATARRDY